MTYWEDDFRDGFIATGPNARWTYLPIGPDIANDGTVTTTKRGLRVVSSGTHPHTGEPAFARTLGQEEVHAPGVLDHIKWLACVNHQASTGYQGFDAVPGQELSCEAWMSGCSYGTEGHPFGSNVINPADDLRLASMGIPIRDPETYLVFDFFLTNEKIYVFYERLPHLRASLGNYAAFLYTIPVADRSPEDWHHFKISYNRSAGVVRWLLDGKEVYRVDRLGCRLASREHMMLDHGGVETRLEPRQLIPSMGLFSILDGALPGHSASGLVRLTKASNHYFNPTSWPPIPQSFLDDESLESNRLFNQGAELNISRYVVSSASVFSVSPSTEHR